jgi:guanylate kinase
MVGEQAFAEWAEVHGNLYGTGRDELERARADGNDILLDLDVQGAEQVRAKNPDAVTVFILPPSYPTLEKRLRGRGQDDEATIRRRLAAAGSEIDAFEKYHYAIVNDEIDECVLALKSIIRAARCRVAVVAARAREIEKTFETTKETRTA